MKLSGPGILIQKILKRVLGCKSVARLFARFITQKVKALLYMVGSERVQMSSVQNSESRPVFGSERRLNAPGEHFFTSSNWGRRLRLRTPFEICDDVLARNVQTAF